MSTVDNGTTEIFNLMKQKNIALCPTLAAGDAIEQYNGWQKGTYAELQNSQQKPALSFKEALKAGVIICMGGDVGVFTRMAIMHGNGTGWDFRNAEANRRVSIGNSQLMLMFLKLMITWLEIQASFADILVVKGDPSKNIHDIRNIKLVM